MNNTVLIVFSFIIASLSLLVSADPDHACQPLSQTPLRIVDDATSVQVPTANGTVTITRVMTACAKNTGYLQPLVPAPGVIPVTELEVLEALSNPNILVVDMRTQEWFIARTIPGAINIPYTEIAMRLDELGCIKHSEGVDCREAKVILGFCNGPACSQSPTAMSAMIREGFPAENIMYYRGGMLDWDALGLTTVQGEL